MIVSGNDVTKRIKGAVMLFTQRLLHLIHHICTLSTMD